MKRQTHVLVTEELKDIVIARIEALPINPLVRVIIEKFHPGATYTQRGLLHKIIGIIADETGHSPAEMKEILKAAFLTPVEHHIGGRVVVSLPSTESLSKSDYSALIDQIIVFATAELGIHLPANPVYNDMQPHHG